MGLAKVRVEVEALEILFRLSAVVGESEDKAKLNSSCS